MATFEHLDHVNDWMRASSDARAYIRYWPRTCGSARCSDSVVPIANPTRLTVARESGDNQGMGDLCRLIWCFLAGLFRSRASLEAEILVLRHQLNVLRRKSPKRLAFRSTDRLVFAGLYRLAPGVLDALKILKPETVIRWHRAGFRAFRPLPRTRQRASSVALNEGGSDPLPAALRRRPNDQF
jgi:hypothetical protein